MINHTSLKKEVYKVLRHQGYVLKGETLHFQQGNMEKVRKLHSFSRAERIREQIDFINFFYPEAKKYIRNSSEIDIAKIKPRIIEISLGSKYERFFRWWNLTWWSLPYERAYGRQMRFLVWDDYHNSPIGLIGLQSPILSWNARDQYLGIEPQDRDYWINQSLSAQRLGALPPYNKLLGGKLVALLMTSDCVRKSFRKKYSKKRTLLMNREIPANLLFITTTGAYGKSSVYNRLGFQNEKICDFIGYTSGYGSFHIPNTLYESFIEYLHSNGYQAKRAYGNGPSVKMKNINKAMYMLGFKNGAEHGMKRAVYFFPLASNLKNVIKDNKKPVWHKRNTDELTTYWKKRWASKRMGNHEKAYFSKEEYIEALDKDLAICKTLAEKRI